jgi:hypothetical protein
MKWANLIKPSITPKRRTKSTNSELTSFLEAKLITGDVLFDLKQFDESLGHYNFALSINDASAHAAKGKVYCYIETERFEDAILVSRDFKFDKLNDPLIFIGLYKAGNELIKTILKGEYHGLYMHSVTEVESKCITFLDYAYKYANKNVQLLKDIAFFYYQMKKYQNVF